jgi:hypothetical protein
MLSTQWEIRIMKKLFLSTVAAAMTLAVGATAQVPTAQQEAARLGQSATQYAGTIGACSGAPVASAEFLPNGNLQVTCSTVLTGTSMNAGAIAGILGAVVVIALVAGDDGAGSTTTTVVPPS